MSDKKEIKFGIVFPPGCFLLTVAVGVVYGPKIALINLGMLTALFTTLEWLGLLK